MAEMLLDTGWWPPQIEFETADLLTVLDIAEQRRRER